VLEDWRREHGGIGRHTRLKILRSYDRGGSSPPARTIFSENSIISADHIWIEVPVQPVNFRLTSCRIFSNT
jgi:hypothetical protein